MMYDMLVNIRVESSTEEEAEQKVLQYLKMSQLDFGLTYDVTDAELVEFPIEEIDNS